MDAAVSPMGIPQYRLNQFVDAIESNSGVNLSMKLYHEKMTIVLKGERAVFLRKFAISEMPKFFNLESNAYNDFIKLYNGGIDSVC